MSRTATQKIISVAVFAIAAAALSFFVADAEAQRAFVPATGTQCLVVTGSVPEDALRVLGSRNPGRESYGVGDVLFVGGTETILNPEAYGLTRFAPSYYRKSVVEIELKAA